MLLAWLEQRDDHIGIYGCKTDVALLPYINVTILQLIIGLCSLPLLIIYLYIARTKKWPYYPSWLEHWGNHVSTDFLEHPGDHCVHTMSALH